jgi:hypothetical protein
MNPIVMRSLGAVFPPRPSDDDGATYGAATAAPRALAAVRRKPLRVVRPRVLMDLLTMVGSSCRSH